jgi:hypothetical protein
MWLVIAFALVALTVVVALNVRARRGAGAARTFRDADIVRALLGLDPEALDELFGLYAKEFGRGAARYARRTRRKWRAGEVRPNRQTFERLLVRLPALMSFDLKCEVLRRLREEYCAEHAYTLSVGVEDWRAAVGPLVAAAAERAYAAELPKQVEKRLKWLAADDMQAARAILAESQARETRGALELLEREFADIARLAAEGGGRVTHTVRLPLGTITLKIRKG